MKTNPLSLPLEEAKESLEQGLRTLEKIGHDLAAIFQSEPFASALKKYNAELDKEKNSKQAKHPTHPTHPEQGGQGGQDDDDNWSENVGN